MWNAVDAFPVDPRFGDEAGEEFILAGCGGEDDVGAAPGLLSGRDRRDTSRAAARPAWARVSKTRTSRESTSNRAIVAGSGRLIEGIPLRGILEGRAGVGHCVHASDPSRSDLTPSVATMPPSVPDSGPIKRWRTAVPRLGDVAAAELLAEPLTFVKVPEHGLGEERLRGVVVGPLELVMAPREVLDQVLHP